MCSASSMVAPPGWSTVSPGAKSSQRRALAVCSKSRAPTSRKRGTWNSEAGTSSASGGITVGGISAPARRATITQRSQPSTSLPCWLTAVEVTYTTPLLPLEFSFTPITRDWQESVSPTYTGSRKRTSRSEEHTSELQSLAYLVCRLLLEKKKKKNREKNTRSKKTRHKNTRNTSTLYKQQYNKHYMCHI